MATILEMLRGAVDRVVGAPTPGTGASPATASDHEPLTAVTVAALRAMLDEHDRGVFLRSALLADLLRRDADLSGALTQRIDAFLSHPVCVDGLDESDAAKAAAESYAAERSRIIGAGAQADMLGDEIMLGFALGQLVWYPDAESGRLVQCLEPWPASAVERDRRTGIWYALSVDQGRLPITPGDGQWVLFAPRSKRAPELWGAIRCVAEPVLRSGYAASDGSRRAEVFGQSIWKASMPTGARESKEGKGFVNGLRNIGRAAVIPTPKGTGPESSYDVELLEAKTDAYKIFEWMMTSSGGRIRLAVLGQDLTSQNNRVGTNASSETGDGVTGRVVEASARGWSEVETQQIAAPRARYLGAPMVKVRVDAEPEEDRKADAEAMGAMADAATKWRGLGVEVDVEKMAAAARVPVLVKKP